ncbi:hypothetical protein [Comamonas sp. C24C]
MSQIPDPTMPGEIFRSQQFQHADNRPGLLFREDWAETPAAMPITQEHVANPDLLLATYGPGKEWLKKSNHALPLSDPFYAYTGFCKLPAALTLRHRSLFADLTGYAKIRWRTKQTHFHRLHVLLKLADGSWLISEKSIGASEDWQESEFSLFGLIWHRFAPDIMVVYPPVANPDLSRVDEIGFTDLMVGTGKADAGGSRVDWIEVHGRAVPR